MYRICFECVHYGEGLTERMLTYFHHGCGKVDCSCSSLQDFRFYKKVTDPEAIADRVIQRLKLNITLEEANEPKQSTQ